MARIVVCGYMLRMPLAGNIATFFQYLVGLQRLGHEVIYLEEKGWPYSCYDSSTGDWTEHPDRGLEVVGELVRRHCPGVPLVFLDRDTGAVSGMAWSDLVAAIRDCDLLIDVGGMCWLEERWLARRRVLIDCDPLFTQVDSFASDILDEYDLRFSYGTNLGSPDCRVPRRGLDWIPSLPPVVVDLWASPDPRPGAGFRTVANWTSYGGITHDGVWYGQKDTEFTRVLDLPVAAPATLEIALSGADDDVRQTFRAAGWRVRDGGEVTRTMDDYRDYIAGSIGEFSVAKHAYVSSHSGWFSERTVCFLAAGRPAVVQDTGFTRWLPGDRGIVAFSDRDGAVAGLHAVVADPAGHAAAARELAARYFDHRVVLTRLLDTALALPRARVGAS